MKKSVLLLLVVIMIAVLSGVSAQAQSIDSTRIDSVSPKGLNPSTQIRIHEQHFGVIPSGSFIIKFGVSPNINDSSSLPMTVPGGTDTSSYVLSGLLPNTTYLCKVRYTYPAVKESNVVSFTTSNCPFQAGFIEDTNKKCVHNLTAYPLGQAYQWKMGGANVIGATSQIYSATASGNYSVAITNAGCTNTSPQRTITVPGVVVNATTNKDPICFGEEVQLNATVFNPNGNETFSWTSTPVGFSSTEKNPKVTPSITTTYKVIVSDGSCSGTSNVKVTVNKNNTIVTLVSAEDSLCNNSVHPIVLTGNPFGGIYSGQWVTQNYFIPDTTFFGTSVATYTITDVNGCQAVVDKTFWVISSPRVILMYFVGRTFVIEGYFPYPIEIKINGIIYHTSDQNSSQALFDNVVINEGEGVTVRSVVGGCFVFKKFSYGLGMEELSKDQKNSDTRIFDILGREVKNPIQNNFYIKGGKKFIYK